MTVIAVATSSEMSVRVSGKSERAEAEHDAIEDDVERREQRADREHADEPRVLRRERRRLEIEGEEEEEHPLIEVLQRVRHREEPQLRARSRRVDVSLLLSGSVDAEEREEEQPRGAERDGEPTRVIETLLRERDDGDAEAERVGRVDPPQLAAVDLHERLQPFARRRCVRHRIDDADVLGGIHDGRSIRPHGAPSSR